MKWSSLQMEVDAVLSEFESSDFGDMVRNDENLWSLSHRSIHSLTVTFTDPPSDIIDTVIRKRVNKIPSCRERTYISRDAESVFLMRG